MDLFDISFILSTLWVGPFWFAMLLNPRQDKTKKLLREPLFFLGPIVIWFIIFVISPPELVMDSNTQNDFLQSLATSFSTKAGLTATWAHLVAGDIFVTRWIWKKGVENNTNIWLLRFSIFFGVMLMPIGLAAFTLFGLKK